MQEIKLGWASNLKTAKDCHHYVVFQNAQFVTIHKNQSKIISCFIRKSHSENENNDHAVERCRNGWMFPGTITFVSASGAWRLFGDGTDLGISNSTPFTEDPSHVTTCLLGCYPCCSPIGVKHYDVTKGHRLRLHTHTQQTSTGCLFQTRKLPFYLTKMCGEYAKRKRL